MDNISNSKITDGSAENLVILEVVRSEITELFEKSDIVISRWLLNFLGERLITINVKSPNSV